MRYDKDEIKNKLTTEQVFSVVKDFGGDPQWTNQGFVSATICHNHPGEGSHKLYYYSNSRSFRCYTECDASFDIFELVSKEPLHLISFLLLYLHLILLFLLFFQTIVLL